MLPSAIKVGRNQQCPCGSQKKFKHCCLNNDSNSGHEISVVSTDLIEKWRDKDFIIDESSPIKMSEVILNLAQPLLEGARTKSERKVAIDVTCMAWNLAIVSENSSFEVELETLFAHMEIKNEGEKREITEAIVDIIKDKKYLYPSIKRLIIDYEIIDSKNEFTLNIASTTDK